MSFPIHKSGPGPLISFGLLVLRRACGDFANPKTHHCLLSKLKMSQRTRRADTVDHVPLLELSTVQGVPRDICETIPNGNIVVLGTCLPSSVASLKPPPQEFQTPDGYPSGLFSPVILVLTVDEARSQFHLRGPGSQFHFRVHTTSLQTVRHHAPPPHVLMGSVLSGLLTSICPTPYLHLLGS